MKTHIPIVDRYFTQQLPPGFSSLFTARAIIQVAAGLLGLFLPLFFYELFQQNILFMLGYYAIGYTLYIFLVPYGAKFLNRFGFKKALIASSLFGALFYLSLLFLDGVASPAPLLFSLVFLTLYRMTYWLPYHVSFSKLTNKISRGRQVSMLTASAQIIGVAAPIVSGAIIAFFGFPELFLIATVLFIVSAIPYLTVPPAEEKYSWSYTQTWRELLKKKNRPLILPFVAEGAENVIGIVVWPVFIFLLLDGNYFEIGALSTFVIGITVAVQLFTGEYIDKDGPDKRKIMRYGSTLYSIGWIIKIFVTTAFHIFLSSLYHNLVKIFMRTPFDTLVYEIAADQGHYVDEFTVLRELAINIGRILTIVLVAIVSLSLPIEWTFALAATSSLALNFLYFRQLQPS